MTLKFHKKDCFLGVTNSLLKKSWIKRVFNKRLSLQISQKYSYSQLISTLLASRNLNINNIDNFLKPTLKFFLPNPLIFNDMDKATKRLFLAIRNNEKISILGDYDVDGLSSIALLKKYFKYLNKPIFSYIPDRIKEGYGPNKKAIDKMKLKKISLLIMVDCGTTAFEEVIYAKKQGIDVIIIDHHKSLVNLPPAEAIINPNCLNDKSGFNYLCATGLTFIFIVFFDKTLKEKKFYKNKNYPNLLNFLDLVALATVCDVVPLIKLNRAFVKQGLKVLANRTNLGLKVMADESKLNNKPDEDDLGFFYGPRINAGGRVGKAEIGERLLNVNENEEAELLVKQLNTFNYQRKLIEEKVFNDSIKEINNRKMEKKNTLVLFKENWHEGVLGIVASRIKDKFNKPVFILSLNNNMIKGSGRSIINFDIGSFVIQAKQKNIISNGGGHQLAAGITLKKNKLKSFENFFEEYILNFDKKANLDNFLNIDFSISVKGVNSELINNIKELGPYGEGNPKPIFAIKNVKVIKPKLVGDSLKHLSLIISDLSGISMKAIAFNCADNDLGRTILSNYKKNLFTFVGYLKESKWNNRNYFEIIIEDGSISNDII